MIALYRSIVSGMTQYASELGAAATIGIDTWGASYGLLDKKGRLLEPVYHYRDKRTETIMDVIYEKVSQRRIFELTGVQFNRSYTLPQLYSCIVNGDTCLTTRISFCSCPTFGLFPLWPDLHGNDHRRHLGADGALPGKLEQAAL